MQKRAKKLKFLIIDEYYKGFLIDFWKKNPHLLDKSFKVQRQKILSEFFGTADFYSYNLKKLGHKAEDLIVNDEVLQRSWAREHNIEVEFSSVFSKIQMLPLAHKFIGRPSWIQKIVLAQIKFYKPDVLYIQNMSILTPKTIAEAKQSSKLVVGQIATSLPSEENIKAFDLILTSFPHYVDKFRKIGKKSEYFKIGFEKRVLDLVKKDKLPIIYDVTFVGSFSPHHRQGIKILEKVAQKLKINFWGQGINFLSPTSPIRKNYHGTAWGINMYKKLAQSKIVINRHISVAENNANNMRLYESTGMGALLITDNKKNLGDLFTVGKDVITYKNGDDLISKIRYYLTHEKEREKIAKSGQLKTLRQHTYSNRMKELIDILYKYL